MLTPLALSGSRRRALIGGNDVGMEVTSQGNLGFALTSVGQTSGDSPQLLSSPSPGRVSQDRRNRISFRVILLSRSRCFPETSHLSHRYAAFWA